MVYCKFLLKIDKKQCLHYFPEKMRKQEQSRLSVCSQPLLFPCCILYITVLNSSWVESPSNSIIVVSLSISFTYLAAWLSSFHESGVSYIFQKGNRNELLLFCNFFSYPISPSPQIHWNRFVLQVYDRLCKEVKPSNTLTMGHISELRPCFQGFGSKRITC